MPLCWPGSFLKLTSFAFRVRLRWHLCNHSVATCVAQSAIGRARFLSVLTSMNPQTSYILKSNKKISHFIRTGRMGEARELFDELLHRNTVTWNSMITGYVKMREMSNARKLFDEMPKRDVVSWNLMISGYMLCHGSSSYMDEGRYLFDQMPERDFASWNTMISGYARNGNMDEALRIFNSMTERNVVSWNAMITGFLQNHDTKSAVQFFKLMPEQDSASLTALISGLIRNGEIDEAAKFLIEYGRIDDYRMNLVHAYNTLIAGYGQRGRTDDARRLFDQIPSNLDPRRGGVKFKRNIVSWNSMIMCYVKAGDILSARELFDQMVERDTFSWNTMISGYVHMSNMKEASHLFGRMHNPDTLSWNMMISGLSQAGNMKLAYDFFERMPLKNRVSWNSIIAGCERNADYEGAINLFRKMQTEGEKPDQHTLSSLLGVGAEFVALHLGMQIHQQVIKIVEPDIPLNNSLITMYARCGAISEARTIFDALQLQKDVISWNAMIGGYASHGLAAEALQLFESMKQLKVQPTYITFISVLNTCSNAGLLEEGRMYFNSMAAEFGIEPRMEHFASLIDLVGRYGKVQEAMDLVSSMPFEPDKAVWGALLGACRVHNHVELARVAAEALMRLEPESSAPYVLLRNMYIDVGQWDDANEVSMMMERNSVRKEVGYSWVNSSS